MSMEGGSTGEERSEQVAPTSSRSPGDSLGPLLTPDMRTYVGIRHPMRADTIVFDSH